MAGCDSKDRESVESIQDSLAEEKTDQWESKDTVFQNEESEENSVVEEPVLDRTVDLTNYSAYIKKMWIVEGWDREYYGDSYSISLVIIQIEEGRIRGYFCINDSIDFYYMHLDVWRDVVPEFNGIIYDGTAECECDYKDGREGKLAITFCENDRIEVRLNDNEKQSYLLRPYNISDEIFRKEPTSYEVELDSWGIVTLFYSTSDSRHSIPRVLLTNNQGDILYDFSTGYAHGSEVLEIVIEDANGDGLQDVKVVTDFSLFPDEDRTEWFFYQIEDGLFSEGTWQ